MNLFKLVNKTSLYYPHVLISAIILYLFKTAFWPLTYLFIFTFAVVVILYLVRIDKKFYFIKFLNNYKLPIIAAVIFFVVGFFNRNLSNHVFQKDLLLIAVMFSLFYFLHWNYEFLGLEIPKRFAINLIILVTFFISLLNILNNISVLNIPTEVLTSLHVSETNTLSDDYNFFCLFIIFGLISINYISKNSTIPVIYYKIITIILSLLFLGNIVLSGSRRGIVAFIILVIIFIIREIVKVKGAVFKKISLKNTSLTIIISSIFLYVGFYFFNKIPTQKISIMVFRYSNFIGENDFEAVNKKLWEPTNKITKTLDSLSFIKILKIKPDNWKPVSNGPRIAKTNSQFGEAIDIKVGNSNGVDFKIYCKMPAVVYFSKHMYQISFKVKTIQGSIDSLNLGWWTDDGGLGNRFTYISHNDIDSIGDGWFNYVSKYTFIDNHVGLVLFLNLIQNNSEYIISNFEIADLNFDPNLFNKEFTSENENEYINWVNKINPPFEDSTNLLMNGDFKYGLKFWNYSADSLTIAIESSDSGNFAKISRGDGNGGYYSLFYAGRKVTFYSNNEYQLTFKIKPIYPKIIPVSVGYWINEGDGYQNNLKLDICNLSDGWLNVKANYTFKSEVSNLVFPLNSQIDNSEFYIKDINLKNLTQYQAPGKTIANVDTINKSNILFQGRSSRLEYAVELWKTKYKWYNKLFGHGFDYYEWFGAKFLNDPVRGDYPHNPFISVILYSGIMGLLLYLWLLWKVFSLYIKHIKNYGVLFMCFLITFFFSFFSGSSPFDPPIMGFFVLLPFFLDHIDKDRVILNDSEK